MRTLLAAEIWPEELEDALRRLVADGNLSASDIAAHLSTTSRRFNRNQILGKCRRMGLSTNGSRGRPSLPPEERPLRVRWRRPSENSARWREHVPKAKALPDIPGPDAVPFSELRRMLAEGTNQCRRFFDNQHGLDGLVCGQATAPGRAFCENCMTRLYR